MLTHAESIAEEFRRSGEGVDLADSSRYYRFNVSQGMEDMDLDECKDVEKMDAITSGYLRDGDVGNAVVRCAQRLIAPDHNGGFLKTP